MNPYAVFQAYLMLSFVYLPSFPPVFPLPAKGPSRFHFISPASRGFPSLELHLHTTVSLEQIQTPRGKHYTFPLVCGSQLQIFRCGAHILENPQNQKSKYPNFMLAVNASVSLISC